VAGIVAALLILVVGGAMGYIRLAPSDPALWNRPSKEMSDPFWQPGQAHDAVGPLAVIEVPQGAAALVGIPRADATEVLQRLDAIAMASARTRRLAYDEKSGLATWITRSAFFGFPDYTTAQVRQDGDAVVLHVFARQRFGSDDFGVNAARLRDWLARLGVD
jgi:hypothetical protein